VSRWIFLRVLGLIYLSAFVSLWVQLDGLVGSSGILPAERLMELARAQLGGRPHLLPTLLWFGASDTFLHVLTGAGTALAVLLTIGIAPVPVLTALWALYLSLSLGGQTFFSFQWDTLLLEAGFLAIWLAPLTVSPRAERHAPVRRPALWLLWWLLFRLMFESAVVKLSSGDPAWADLAALRYHFETQPLPTWIGWYAHQLPAAVLWLSTAGVFVIEGLVPFLIFGGNRLRRVACGALVALQVVILATGNYCFFNLLAIALCVLLLDDATWPARLRRWVTAAGSQAARRKPRSWPSGVLIPVTVALFIASLAPTAGVLGLGLPASDALFAAYRWLQPFRTINSYGLFAVMTTERPEIIVEGTLDGNNWQPYEFRYKPGDLRRAPGFVAPHQPRLDWQMWFAALGSVDQNPWFLHFLQALLRGSAAVEGLLGTNPFPDKPPLAVRAIEYDYHFTSPESRAATGDWWTRENRREYCPAVRLNAEGELVLFEAVPLLPAAPGPTP
jgi:lipase maturation factor 1